MSPVSIAGGLVIVPELQGIIHCVDLATGKAVWRHDAESNIWGGALVADGKAYLGNESGELLILSAGKEKRLISKVDMGGPIFSTPIVANGVVYVCSGSSLYALKK